MLSHHPPRVVDLDSVLDFASTLKHITEFISQNWAAMLSSLQHLGSTCWMSAFIIQWGGGEKKEKQKEKLFWLHNS